MATGLKYRSPLQHMRHVTRHDVDLERPRRGHFKCLDIVFNKYVMLLLSTAVVIAADILTGLSYDDGDFGHIALDFGVGFFSGRGARNDQK